MRISNLNFLTNDMFGFIVSEPNFEVFDFIKRNPPDKYVLLKPSTSNDRIYCQVAWKNKGIASLFKLYFVGIEESELGTYNNIEDDITKYFNHFKNIFKQDPLGNDFGYKIADFINK